VPKADVNGITALVGLSFSDLRPERLHLLNMDLPLLVSRAEQRTLNLAISMAKFVLELKCRVALVSVAPRFGAAWTCELPQISPGASLIKRRPEGEDVVVLDSDFEAIGP
jgi:hypothetical protein